MYDVGMFRMIPADVIRERLHSVWRGAVRQLQRYLVPIRRHAPQVGGGLTALFLLASLYAYYGIYQPSAFFPVRTIVTVPEGATLQDAADIFYEAQAVRSSLALRAVFKFMGEEVQVRAGRSAARPRTTS